MKIKWLGIMMLLQKEHKQLFCDLFLCAHPVVAVYLPSLKQHFVLWIEKSKVHVLAKITVSCS